MPNVNNAAIVPNSRQPIGEVRNGLSYITTPWQRFFNTLLSAPAPILSVAPTGSPFAYRAGSGGTLVVSGGTVSAITLTRNQTTIGLGSTSGAFSVANGDVVTVTYSGLPTVSFVPL